MQGQLFTQDFLHGCATGSEEAPASHEQAVLLQYVSGVAAFSLPVLAKALAQYDLEARRDQCGGHQRAGRRYTADYLDELRWATLILLWRILFLLNAEDRGLLVLGEPGYGTCSLRRLRELVRDHVLTGKPFATRFPRYWLALQLTFNVCDAGDDALGLPACSTGLFARECSPLLERTFVPDAVLAPVIHALSSHADLAMGWIDYNKLPASNLVDIGERLLQLGLVQEAQATNRDDAGELSEIHRMITRAISPSRDMASSRYGGDKALQKLLREAANLIESGQVLVLA